VHLVTHAHAHTDSGCSFRACVRVTFHQSFSYIYVTSNQYVHQMLSRQKLFQTV